MAEVTGRDRAGGPPRPPAPAGPARRLEAIDVLRLILSDEDLLPSGRAQMVSLHAAMRKLGPDWSRFSSKVVDLADPSGGQYRSVAVRNHLQASVAPRWVS